MPIAINNRNCAVLRDNGAAVPLTFNVEGPNEIEGRFIFTL